MSKTCIKHPNIAVFTYDPFCESIWCKECYEKMNQVYEQLYKNENDRWVARKYVTREQVEKYWPKD